jgi:hypothetical protein
MPKPLKRDKFTLKGFDPLSAPEIPIPTFPASIASKTLDDLGDIMSFYAVWREYTEDLHLRAVADYTRQKEAYDFEWQKIFLSVNGRNNTEREAKIAANPEIIVLRALLIEAEMYKEMLSAKLLSFNNAIAVISREISRRQV